MSIVKVEQALLNFGACVSPNAIVLKGDWGTGKTYFWNRLVKNSFSSFCRTKYSYVSLFGLNSLSDLKRSVFENTVPSSRAGSRITKDSVIENLKKLDLSDASTGFRRFLSFGKEARVPFVGSFGGLIDSVQYATVSDTIICIDDFERRGAGLSSRDVLGLISNLVEFKNCSVVLVLNEGSLKKDDEFFSFSEKVFDYEVTFAPSVQESVELVFGSASGPDEALAENASKLAINNIRILKKIEMFSEVLSELLRGKHARVVQQAYSTLPLAVFAIYGGGKCKADIDFILSYQGRVPSYLPDNAEGPDGQEDSRLLVEEKAAYLDEYGFGSCDELDVAIIDFVKKGYVDDDSVKALVDELEKNIQHATDVALLGQAWNLFHSSFADNEAEVFRAFELAVSTAFQYLNLNDLDSVAWVYFETGREEVFIPVIDRFFEEVFPKHGIKDRDNLFQPPQNTYVLQKLNQYFDGLTVKGSLSELVQAVMSGAGLPDAEYRTSIAQKTSQEFYDYFNGVNGVDFTQIARMLLKCGEVYSHDTEATNDYTTIFLKTYEALLRLSERSSLNSIRMHKFRKYEGLYKARMDGFNLARKSDFDDQ